jgi:hypothetical protein
MSVVKNVRPGLARYFHQRISVAGKYSSDIDYLSASYGACYAAINPKATHRSLASRAESALWRLARIRDIVGFGAPGLVELVTWIPPKGLPIFSGVEYELADAIVDELNQQAATEGLSVFSVFKSEEASNRVLQHEQSFAPQ